MCETQLLLVSFEMYVPEYISQENTFMLIITL